MTAETVAALIAGVAIVLAGMFRAGQLLERRREGSEKESGGAVLACHAEAAFMQYSSRFELEHQETRALIVAVKDGDRALIRELRDGFAAEMRELRALENRQNELLATLTARVTNR